ncbi:helix-turn-helix domain-containing protein [Clostridioides difficile]
MNKLVGVRWGDLLEITKEDLLERANCINGINGDLINEGECIIDLTNELSVDGNVVDGEVIINDDSIIYNPAQGVLLESKEVNFEVNNIMTVSEAAEIWGKTEGAIRAAIKAKKFIVGVDYRKAKGTTLITKEAMERVYGKL